MVKRPSPWLELVSAVLYGYAIIFFARSRALGLVLLAATFLAPQYGALGLAGVLVALTAAEVLGFAREETRNGAYLFNALLASLALAWTNQAHPFGAPLLALLLVSVSLLALFLTVFLSAALARPWGLPAMSLPFVLVAVLLCLLTTHGTAAAPAYLLPEPAVGPAPVLAFLRACGAIFFLPHVLVGGVAFLVLLTHSRLAALYAVLGYAVGYAVLVACHATAEAPALGFNFIFCAIAVGGIFVVPSRGSLALVLLGSTWTALLGIGCTTAMHGLGIPPLALPFNLAVLTLLAALGLRPTPRHAYLTPFAPETPEANYHRFHAEARRFPDAFRLHLTLPFFGEWTITQGVDGALTHRGAWAHALDFEIVDPDGRRYTGDGSTLTAYHAYRAPVVAPCYGTVVKVVNDVEDNPIGGNNLDANWGNLVLILTDTGVYVLLCHLAQWSVAVVEGERVAPGKALGKCGNSGRSPVPHLHLQMQASDRLGSPTIPFILCQYVEGQGAERRYRTAGLPAAGSRVRPVLFDETMTSCFDMVIGRRLRYRLRDGGEREETLTVTVDDTGAYVFTAPAAGAVLTARILHKVWYVLDYRERRRSLLRDFWLGLSRCPLTTEDGLRWTERLDPAPLLPPPLRVLLDLAAPFTAFPEIVVEHVLTTCRGRVGGGEALARIATTVTAPRGLAWALRGTPRRVELTLGPHHGILGGSVVRGDGTRVEIERLEELELQPAGRAG